MKKLFLFWIINSVFFFTRLQAESKPLEESIETTIASLNLEQKVGQLFISIFFGSSLDEETKIFIAKSHLGNFIYFSWSNNLSHPLQVQSLSEELFDFVYNANRIPPLICIDQEGGIVSRLKEGYTQFPGNMALGAIQETPLCYQAGRVLGRELRESGIHLNLAPVVDVNSNWLNPVIGVRSFSNHPQIVSSLAKTMIQGFHEEGIGATLKHFPGHGDSSQDSHTHLPIVRKTLQELQTNELVPFQSLKDDADCIMTAHVIYPALDTTLPATLSPNILTDLLRHDLGYKGVVISDSLMMRGVSPNLSSFEEAVNSVSTSAIQAFLAGCDLLILAKLEWADFVPTKEQSQELIEKIVENFTKAVKEGKISNERLDDSLKRILQLKAKYAHKNTHKKPFLPDEPLCKEIAKKSLTLWSSKILWNRTDTHLTGKKWVLIAPEELRASLQSCVKKEEFSPSSLLYFSKEDLKSSFPQTLQKAKELISSSELTLFLSFNAHLVPEQKDLLIRLSEEFGKDKLLIAGLCNPQDLSNIKDHLILLTYSPCPASLSLLFETLNKKEQPQGIIPFTPL